MNNSDNGKNIGDIKHMVDITLNRRMYYNDECDTMLCPECNFPLIENGCTILLGIRSSSDEGEVITNLTGSHFCNSCPVVVFDKEKIVEATKLGIRGGKELQYKIKGIIDLNAIPKEKRHLPLGTDENPIKLITFLPPVLDRSGVNKHYKVGRNEPCPCGSGKKYKKCCGRSDN